MNDFAPQNNFQENMNKHFVCSCAPFRPPYIKSVIILIIFPIVGIATLAFCFMSNYYADKGNFERAADLAKAADIVDDIILAIIGISMILLILIFGSLALISALNG